MTDRIYIFSNGSQYADWQASNCERCKKIEQCEIWFALDDALWDDGTVSQEIAKRAGYDADRYLWPCGEVEWTEEWKTEHKRMIIDNRE